VGLSDQGAVDPDLRLGDPRGKSRYPSPFFDVGQQYIPPTVKELFKWVYFYCTNNSFLGPALKKISRYPITDLILEDPAHEVVSFWTSLLNNVLQIKTFNMEVNTDLTSYGNAFVTIHFPFSRQLECQACKGRFPWKSVRKKIENMEVRIVCPRCKTDGKAKMVDIPYRSMEHLRLIRINPEYIDIKYNDASGKHTYLYNIPDRLKRQLMSGDPDILEDTPQVYFDAIRMRRKIKLSNQNLFHLKDPTLAGKDMGWGMPRVATALKDLYYFYTMRRSQEAILNEHIVPFDMIFPQANGKMDPYVHTNLGNWRTEMRKQLANRRQDPNYKAILPFPVGHLRMGGDGKAMLMTPEMDFLAKTIVGAMGIPQEFIYGGSMQWSGSSISLRTLENDFLHHRSQLLQMNIWLVERVRLYMGIAAPKSIRFSDFKMADDMPKLQMMINMAVAGNLPWSDILTELGRDPVVVQRKLEQEAQNNTKLFDIRAAQQAQGQVKGQLLAQRLMLRDQQEQAAPGDTMITTDSESAQKISEWAAQIAQLPAEAQEVALRRLQMVDSTVAKLVEREIKGQNDAHQQQLIDQGLIPAPPVPPEQQGQFGQPPQQPGLPSAGGAPGAPKKQQQPGAVNMAPLPTKLPPRRASGQ